MLKYCEVCGRAIYESQAERMNGKSHVPFVMSRTVLCRPCALQVRIHDILVELYRAIHGTRGDS